MIAELSLIPILVLYFFILDLFCLILYSLSIPPYFLFIFSTYTIEDFYTSHSAFVKIEDVRLVLLLGT